MGRTKNIPKKKDNLILGNCSLSTIGEFIPLFRKKRSKKQGIHEKSIPSYSLILAKEEHEQYLLGELRVGCTSNVLPGDFNSYSCVIIRTLEDVLFLKDAVQTRMFAFKILMKEDIVYFQMYLIAIPLPKFYPKISRCIKTAFALFYDIELDTEKDINKIQTSLSSTELDDLYIKLVQKREMLNINDDQKLCIPQLKPKLRPYQEKAVKWMIFRETADDLKGDLHPLYQKVTLKSSTDIYFDKYTGWIEKKLPIVQGNWKGGILADEMGLGKTVEVLALILSNNQNRNKSDNSLMAKKGKIKDADSGSESELIIRTQPKKRKMIEEDHEDYQVPIKKNKIPDNLVKVSSSKKSATFQALQSIYNRTLSEYCTTESKEEPEECRVQCICGSSIEDGSVECEECGKYQHSSCLGWRRSLGAYKCPQCWEKLELLPSKATLIVAPAALRRQWCREMKTHLKYGLKVLNYEGYSATPVYPTELQHYDIVITTYNVLQAEMRLTETGQSLNLRKQRKYWPGGSPLVRIQWWRLCLDEAQTVETPGRVVSQMARKIPAVHRWAVTGTPMAKSLTDIYGLIDYLQMEPYSEYDTWKNILYNPYLKGNKEPMYTFLSKVLWRTGKKSVLDQINIPQQTHEIHLLEFSAVEKFFYNREHEICARDFLYISQKFNSDCLLEKMDKKDLKNLMAPLLSLRQACSDPSAVRGKGRYLSLKKNASSMKELLEALILKNRTDCEESLRLMVSSINGLAGVYLLMEDYEQAIKEYRKVLQLSARFAVEEKQGKLTVDKLPLIHAMYNLAEVLDIYESGEHTLRDGTLRDDCLTLEKQYIEKFMKETASGKEDYETVSSTIEQYEDEFILKHAQWYSDGLDWVSINSLDGDLIARIEVAADNAHIDFNLRIENARTLLRRVYNWHLDVDDSRENVFKVLNNIYTEDTATKYITIREGLVEKAMDCHLRPQQQKVKKKMQKCAVCLADAKLKEYESKLFTMKKRSDIFDEMSLVGSWKPRIEEIILKGLLSLLKLKDVKSDLIKDGETHVQLIDVLKKEFKEIRKFWTLLDQQVCAIDELDICKVRLQLKTADEAKEKANKMLKNLSYDQTKTNDNINLLKQSELPHQELSLKSEEARHNMKLEALLGTRNYLDTLRQQQFEGQNPDPCPVCRGPLVNTWAILSCAHTFCLECFQKLLDKSSISIQCCVCRFVQSIQEVAYIGNGKNSAENTEENIPIVGNYSRKVEDVVRLLLKLKNADSQVKVLLFSTWSVVLKLLKRALEENHVKAELADSSSTFEKRIETFKDPIRKITVLLLPLRLGSKGLNLIEATHVILLEPVLNPADELQAIGRIHRIGQTKPTVVHKFLVRNTVEESLHEATSSNAAGWERSKVTIEQLKGLFKNNFGEEEEEELVATLRPVNEDADDENCYNSTDREKDLSNDVADNTTRQRDPQSSSSNAD
ncbi:hypothetical protein GWI33_004494 [Rhynchophorus ferrugineus]|uniref:E3 ubiquitin-protein ligase SHPRH n=1 Tax=Rhynchophorus ferrugineus TaxID=354439 RepID=A0A834IPF0_RHYFE|nr:hypothetical protein GWI33_004494 [Rhynchophorus ferrugineus]